MGPSPKGAVMPNELTWCKDSLGGSFTDDRCGINETPTAVTGFYTYSRRRPNGWMTGSLWQAFVASVRHLAAEKQLDISVLHGDGTNTVAKKGGDGIGYSGYKHQKGEKIIAITDNHGYILAPVPVAPVNETDMVLVPGGAESVETGG